MAQQNQPTFFAPQLFMKNVKDAMTFYQKSFDAKELRRFSNSDGSVHVAEMTINDSLFHLHEEVSRKNQLSPEPDRSVSVLIGLFTDDPDTMFRKALEHGAIKINDMQDYDYGYRQGVIQDPFGHQWMLQKKLKNSN